jgi:chromosome segregation ATPase
VRANEELDVYAAPDVSAEAFRKMCTEAAFPKYEAEAKKEEARWRKKIDTAMKKLSAEERELEEDKQELKMRRREENLKHAENVFGIFTGKRRSMSTSLSKRRMTEKAKADVEESEDEIAQIKREIASLQAEMADAMDAVGDKWRDIVADVSDATVQAYKKDIDVHTFGVAWFPYHLVKDGKRIRELPGFRE